MCKGERGCVRWWFWWVGGWGANIRNMPSGDVDEGVDDDMKTKGMCWSVSG